MTKRISHEAGGSHIIPNRHPGIRFAHRAGIQPACLSRARNGKGNAEFYFPRILNEYPEVRREWLYSGKGEPTYSKDRKSRLEAKMERIEKELAELKKMVRGWEKSFSNRIKTPL